jgi:gliding motility-associated-like protein
MKIKALLSGLLLSVFTTIHSFAQINVNALTVTNVLCNGASTGQVTTTPPTGGTPPYSFQWNTTPIQNTQNAIGVPAGTYTVMVIDAAGDTAFSQTIVTQPNAILITTNIQVNVFCNGGNNGAASVNVSGGVGPYSYNWTPGNPSGDGTPSVTGLTPGNWTCIVSDANGCSSTKLFVITQPPALVVSTVSQIDVLCNGGNTGAATVSVSGGTPAYTYNWSPGDPPGDGTPSATGLTAGAWTCQVIDANGCISSQSFTINEPDALIVNTTSQINVNCFGGNDGAAGVIAFGGTGALSYDWQPGNPIGDGTPTASGLTAGTWTCVVSDANGCTASQSFNILEPPDLIISPVSQVNISCFGGNDGSATVSVAGGVPQYSYNWSPGNPTGDGTPSVSGLTAGTWTCSVVDANNCIETYTFTITEPPVLSASILNQTNASCFGNFDGAITISVTGGNPTYNYDWEPGNPPGDGTPSIVTLAAGTYTCTVTDANGCSTTISATITQPSEIITSIVSQTNITCFGGNDGAATITASGGTGSLSYDWTPDAPVGDLTASASGLTAGTWFCVVTDATGCTTIQDVNITEPDELIANVDNQSSLTCFGSNDGNASVLVTGGTPGYTYDWSPGNPIGDGTPSINSLTPNTYSCLVTDANGCTATQTFVIAEPTVLVVTPVSQVNVACFGDSTGTATVDASGGWQNYTYDWQPGSPAGEGTPTASGLLAGNYTVVVTDLYGCTASASFVITESNEIIVNPINQVNNICFAGNIGEASVNASGGVGTLSYNWEPGNPTGDGTPAVTGLTSGSWSCIVTDANGCTVEEVFTITEPNEIVISTTVQDNVSCNGADDGSVTISVTGGTGAYTYIWTPGNPTGNGTPTISQLAPGTYYCEVTDINGCSGMDTIVITEPNVLTVSVASLTNVSCNSLSDGEITLSVTGGTPDYSFNWSPGNPTGDGTETITNLNADTWNCIVTDLNNCSDTIDVVVTEPAVLNVDSLTQTNILCNGANTGSATVIVTGGIAPYNYSWLPINDSTATATNLTAGNWECTVTDSNGCSASYLFNITEPTPIDITVTSQTNLICNGGNDGNIAVDISGGIAPYIIDWSPGSPTGDGTDSISNLTAGLYTCLVTDTNSCVDSINVTISEPINPPTITISGNTILCPNEGTTLTASGLDFYLWNTGDTTATINISPGQTGNYSVTGFSFSGCSGTDSITVVNFIDIFGPTDAVDDTATTELPNSVAINLAANDSGLNTITILNGPTNGTFVQSGDTIIYTPVGEFIGQDIIQYVSCNTLCASYCDTATVIINITLNEVIIPELVTANGDGFNDKWVIKALVKYPQNKVFISNRWGDIVFQAEPYNNDWDGQSNSGTIIAGNILPDGTYFYHLQLEPNGEIFKGFIELIKK